MFRIMLFCFLMFISVTSFSQKIEKEDERDMSKYGRIKQNCIFCLNREWAFSGALILQQPLSSEICFIRTSLQRPYHGMPKDGQYVFKFFQYSYLIIGAEQIYKPTFQIAPKLGIGYNFLLFNGSVSYTFNNKNFKKFYPAITPEIGISLLGRIQISYGYSFIEKNEDIFERTKHRLVLRFNYFFGER